jgi:hypothetical protein
MKKILIFFSCLLLLNIAYSNSAMPGMWSTGHGARFIPLFKEDSVHFGKIQMQKELVMINLYPGFGAIKGEYWMYNTTNEPITIRVGYPINGRYDQDLVSNVMFDDIYNLKVLVNDAAVNVLKPAEGYDSVYRVMDEQSKIQMQNWYYWTCTFAPKQLTKITVYFLTNNNEANLGRGYSREKGNGFAYILETGRAWAGEIESGQVLIRLKNELSLKDFNGIYPVNTLVGDDKHLKFSFTNLEPDSSDNILLWYAKRQEGFSFDNITKNAEQYFKELDAFPLSEFNNSSFKTLDKNDFKPHDSSTTWFWVVLIGVLLLGVALVVGVIVLIYKFIKRAKRKRD